MDPSLQARALCAVPIGAIPVNDEFIALEIDDDRCGRLQFELPLDVTDAEIEYIRSLVPSVQSGTLEQYAASLWLRSWSARRVSRRGPCVLLALSCSAFSPPSEPACGLGREHRAAEVRGSSYIYR